jgi:protein SCO1/2
MRPASLLIALAAVTLQGCTAPSDRTPDPDDLALRGTKPYEPLPKVSFTLTDTRGRPYDFRARTDGHITLLFFGYTYCPDVCPVHMATLASAMEELDPAVRDGVRVVFVSVDPQRDTPERLHKWLSSFDSSFVGLRGTEESVAGALAFYRYPPPERSGEEEGYTVGHPAFVYAFTPDNRGRALYGVETTRAMWVHDLSLMAHHAWRDAASAASDSGAVRPLGQAGDVRVLDAYVPRPAAGDVTAVYLTLRNDGARPDTLLAVASDASARGSLHDMERADGQMRMVPMQGGLVIPPGETVSLAPGGRHGMLEGLERELEPGSTLNLILRFARGGTLAVPARVVRYEDLVR